MQENFSKNSIVQSMHNDIYFEGIGNSIMESKVFDKDDFSIDVEQNEYGKLEHNVKPFNMLTSETEGIETRVNDSRFVDHVENLESIETRNEDLEKK